LTSFNYVGNPTSVKAALARRGVSPATMDEIIALDVEHRELLQEAERLRAEVKFPLPIGRRGYRDKETQPPPR